ncbi:MAG TPA: folate-binding protein YgfZ [Curvibacter sp.]|nr:folate-binding protein YgfZ [Curvibacter sp.]
MNNTLNGMAPLPHLGVIRAEGEDAAKFLHGQLTQDFALLGLSEARLAAFCSAKGRMQASFVAFKRSHTEILLICSRDLLAQTLKRLTMFVLRAKVKLSDATDSIALLGLAGPALRSLAGADARPWTCQVLGEAHLVHLYPSDGVPRALWVAPAGTAQPSGPALRQEDWLWGEVRSGVAMVSQPIFEALVPQMLNYESVGGVNFKKGCYPGQEVVARSQFRGTLKRRGYLVHGEAAMQAGQEIYATTNPEQPCGLVAQAAPAPTGGWDAIVSLQTASAQDALHLGKADGPALTLLPLPYALLDDI